MSVSSTEVAISYPSSVTSARRRTEISHLLTTTIGSAGRPLKPSSGLPCRGDSYSGLASYGSAFYSGTENGISRLNASGNVAEYVDAVHMPAKNLRGLQAQAITHVNVQKPLAATSDVTKDWMPRGKMAQIVIGGRPALTLEDAVERFVEQRSETCMSFAPGMKWSVTPWDYNTQAGRYEQAGESARFHPLHVLDGINQGKGRKREKNR